MAWLIPFFANHSQLPTVEYVSLDTYTTTAYFPRINFIAVAEEK